MLLSLLQTINEMKFFQTKNGLAMNILNNQIFHKIHIQTKTNTTQSTRAFFRRTVFKKAMTLPGSRPDILRTANVPGPSPVGGSKGGTEGRRIQALDEFEYQAAHYNMACAYASLGNVGEAVLNLRKAFDYGFDNYATVRADPDLEYVRGSTDYDRLMEEYDPKRGFFGVFGK